MRFIASFLTVVVVLQMAIVVINVAADEEGRLWSGVARESWMARQMNRGCDIAGRQDFRIRALVRERIIQAETAPEIAVLGSSRALLLGESLLHRRGVANYSVSSSRLAHYVSVMGLLLQRGWTPKTVLIGADPWIFKSEQLNVWPLEDGAKAWARNAGGDLNATGIREERPWAGYFSVAAALKALAARKEARGACDVDEIRRDDRTACAVRRHDGSLKYPDEKDLPADIVGADVAKERGRMHSYQGYRVPDPERIQLFRFFLADLKRRDIEVVIFLPPYHPLIEEQKKGKQDWRLTQEAEAVIRNIARELDIPVFGAYSARAAACTAEEFYDSIHAKGSCVAKVLAPWITAAVPSMPKSSIHTKRSALR